jgi:hypothetical protein
MTERLPNWVDGQKFVAWLSEIRPDYRSVLDESQGRNLYRMTEDAAVASLARVDRICVALDLHICEIPDDVWTEPPPNRGRRHSLDTKAEALAMVEDGATVRETADALSLNGATIRYWIREARS